MQHGSHRIAISIRNGCGPCALQHWGKCWHDMESAIQDGYAAYVREKHTEAPTPAFYHSGELVANAHDLRQTMGDEMFFNKLLRQSRAIERQRP